MREMQRNLAVMEKRVKERSKHAARTKKPGPNAGSKQCKSKLASLGLKPQSNLPAKKERTKSDHEKLRCKYETTGWLAMPCLWHFGTQRR